jgi:antitoxin CptB
MTDDAETRRRRAGYRASHRGTKEMDWTLGRFAEDALARMSPEEIALFERLLELPDPVLEDMIRRPESTPAGEFEGLIAQVRAFHKLGYGNR